MEKQTILVTATTFPRYKDDTEPSFVFYLCKEMDSSYNQIVLVPSAPNAKDEEELDGIKVKRFRYFFKKHQNLCYDGGIRPNMEKSVLAKFQVPFLFFAELLAVRRVVKKQKIDLIHAHWILPQGYIAYLMKKWYHIPYIATAHAGDVFPLKNKFLKALAKKVIKNADFATANSNFTKKTILEIFPNLDKNKIAVVPMGVDLANFNHSKKSISLRYKYKINRELLLTVGRLAEKKGIKYVIEAMPKVLEEFPEAKLMVVGDGPEKQDLIKLTTMQNLGHAVIFVSKVSHKELPKFYASADLFIGPSIVTKSGDTEGLGVVFLEALASGTPVIGSNVGGIPDIIKEGVTGVLVEEKNPEELAKKIIELLKHKELRDKTVKNGKALIEKNYSWESVGKKFRLVYEKVLRGNKTVK